MRQIQLLHSFAIGLLLSTLCGNLAAQDRNDRNQRDRVKNEATILAA
jgi:hypothetical protein